MKEWISYLCNQCLDKCKNISPSSFIVIAFAIILFLCLGSLPFALILIGLIFVNTFCGNGDFLRLVSF